MINISTRFAAAGVAGICGLVAAPAYAELGVAPLTVELSPALKSTVVTVTGKTKPGQFLQVSAKRWTQDAQGNDRYEDTDEIIFLPKQVDLSKAQKQLIRVGTERPVTDVEKAYRLFIRETPPPVDASGQKGAQIAVVVDFALPVYIVPAKITRTVAIRDAKVEKGVLTLNVVNTGNVRVRVESLTAGKAQFKDFKNWYLLAGATRAYTATLPRDACSGTLTVQLRTVNLNVKQEVAVTPQMCG